MKDISIIIPVYNAENFIAECLNSILKNDFDNIEIIAINDGSVDKSFEILDDFRSRYPEKIRIFNQENQGVANSRNKGILLAEGRYVMFIDNDDYVDCDYIRTYFEKAEAGSYDMVIGGYKRVSQQGLLYDVKLANLSWSKYIIMAPWAKIYKRDFLLKNKLEFLDNNIGEDVYLNLVAINLTKNILVTDYCGYNWFYNENSISNTKQKSVKNKPNVIFLLDSCYEKLRKIDALKKEENEFYFLRYLIWYLLFTGRNSSFAELYAEFKKSFDWLKNKFPNFNENKSIGLLSPKGESLKNRIAVFAFMIFYRLRIMSIFFRLYSKKD